MSATFDAVHVIPVGRGRFLYCQPGARCSTIFGQNDPKGVKRRGFPWQSVQRAARGEERREEATHSLVLPNAKCHKNVWPNQPPT